MQLGDVSKLDVGKTQNDCAMWRGTDTYEEGVSRDGDWTGFVYTTSTDGKIEGITPSQYLTNAYLGETNDVSFGNITMNNEFRHRGLFTGSSEVGYTIPASSSTDGYLYYYQRIQGNNINEYRVVFVIQTGSNTYTSHELIAKNISGSGGQPPPS